MGLGVIYVVRARYVKVDEKPKTAYTANGILESGLLSIQMRIKIADELALARFEVLVINY